jgi:hypothetical protein
MTTYISTQEKTGAIGIVNLTSKKIFEIKLLLRARRIFWGKLFADIQCSG